MAGLQGLTYRFSTAEDIDSIRALDSGLNSELDYILEKYTSFLKKPVFFGCVAELKGEVIAFGAVTVQLQGTKLYSRSGRVKKAYRNHGVYGQIKAFFRRAVKEAGYPDLRVEEFTTHDTNPSLYKLLQSPVYHEVYRRPFRTYELTSSSEEVIKTVSCRDENVQEIGVQGLHSILMNKSLCQSLFPVRAFVGLVTFEPLLSELERIAEYKPYVVATFVTNETDISQLTIGVSLSSKLYIIQWIVPSDSDSVAVSKGFAENLNEQLENMVLVTDGGWCMIVFDGPYEHTVESVAKLYGFETVKPFSECFIGFRRDF